MKFTPLQNYVLLKGLKPEETTSSGIILPNDNDKERNQGVVVALGNECKFDVSVDDKVLFVSYGFTEVEIEKEMYLVGKEDNIIGKLC